MKLRTFAMVILSVGLLPLLWLFAPAEGGTAAGPLPSLAGCFADRALGAPWVSGKSNPLVSTWIACAESDDGCGYRFNVYMDIYDYPAAVVTAIQSNRDVTRRTVAAWDRASPNTRMKMVETVGRLVTACNVRESAAADVDDIGKAIEEVAGIMDSEEWKQCRATCIPAEVDKAGWGLGDSQRRDACFPGCDDLEPMLEEDWSMFVVRRMKAGRMTIDQARALHARAAALLAD